MGVASAVVVGAYTRQYDHDGQESANEVVPRIDHAQCLYGQRQGETEKLR